MNALFQYVFAVFYGDFRCHNAVFICRYINLRRYSCHGNLADELDCRVVFRRRQHCQFYGSAAGKVAITGKLHVVGAHICYGVKFFRAVRRRCAVCACGMECRRCVVCAGSGGCFICLVVAVCKFGLVL